MNEFDYYWEIFIRWMTTPIMGSDSGITISNMLGFVLIVFVAWWASAKVEKILQRMTLGKYCSGKRPALYPYHYAR